jgi:Glyoxalase/Bleomycin resistance protein/Dioxygenase superfamily
MFAGTHFQNGYVCDDIEAAIAAFQAAGLKKQPRILTSNDTVDTPDGPRAMELKVAIFRLAGLTYELIQPVRDETGVYANAPDNGGAVRFHHTCCRVDDWQAFKAEVAGSGFPLAMERDYGEGQTKYAYFDGRASLGHYVEFMWMPEEQFRA